MAAITSAAHDKFFDEGSAWTGGVVPVSGDTVTISHRITVRNTHTVGHSPAASDATAAILVNGTAGSLTIAGGTLIVRGDLKLNNSVLTCTGTGVLEFDASAAASPSTARYVCLVGTGAGQASCKVTVLGTDNDNRFTIRSNASGANARFSSGGSRGCKHDIRYCNFTRIGDASNSAFVNNDGGGGDPYKVYDSTFDACGRYACTQASATSQLELVRCRFINGVDTLSTSDVNTSGNATALTTGTRLIDSCVFSRPLKVDNPAGFTIKNNYISYEAGACYASSSGGPWTLLEDNLFRSGTSGPLMSIWGNTTRNYVVKDHETFNPHGVQLSNSTTAMTIQGFILDYTGVFDDGDALIGTNASVTHTIRNWLYLPNAKGWSAGTMGMSGGNIALNWLHNTFCSGKELTVPAGETGIRWGENNTGYSGMYPLIESNLAWSFGAARALVYLAAPTGTGVGTITAATKANPCVITSTAASLITNGSKVYIYGVSGMTQLNGNIYTVANKTASTFQLQGVDSTGYGTFSGTASFVVTDQAPASGVDYNATWNGYTGSAGLGYHAFSPAVYLFSSGTPGVHDIGDVNPQFVDAASTKWRCFALFSIDYLGYSAATAWNGSATYAVGDFVSNVVATRWGGRTVNYRCIQAHDASVTANDEPGSGSAWHTYWEFASAYRLREGVLTQTYDGVTPKATIRDLNEWVKAGFAVRAIPLRNAGHDGVTVGAVEGVYATAFTFEGPTSGMLGAASSNFTVTPNGNYDGTVTPSDGGAGGTFNPTSLTWTGDNAAKTFTYTPSAGGTVTVSLSNSWGLTNPASISFVVTASSYTLTGPSGGVIGVASSNFSVAPNLVFTGTVTPSDGGAGGTFTPTSLSWSSSTATKTFTYTPVSPGGAITISTSDNGGLSDPSPLTYTATASTYTFTGPSSGKVGAASTNFTLTPDGPLTGTITPSDGGAGGTFNPTSLTWSANAVAKTFTYTPIAPGGAITLSTTNNASLTDPNSLTYTGTASTYTLDGPVGGSVSVASGDFTVTPNAPYTGTITPSSNGGGGSFSPTSLTFSASMAPQTFTYTPASSGIKTISTANNGGLTNPSSLSYTVTPTGEADAYTISGPSTGKIGVASTNFNVIPNGTFNGTITFSDNGAGGTFTPTSRSWTGDSTIRTFTYTPVAPGGNVSITASNNAGLTDPGAVTYHATASSYTLSGPASGKIGSASTNFTLTPNGPFSGVITPSDGGVGGTFTPASRTFSDSAAAQTFTYTPIAPGGAITISTSDNGGLTDPSPLTYTATASTYTLTGPSSGTVGVASGNFTITPNGPFTGVITPNDSGAGGTFTPTSLSFSASAVAQTFTYTSALAGVRTIGATNNSTLTNPSSVSFTAASVVTSYLFAGPSSGTVGVASSNFTVTLGSGTQLSTVRITPDDASAGGTFTPAFVDLTNSVRSGTFTYTAATSGVRTLSVTNNGGLSNPGSISFLAAIPAATAYTFSGPSSGYTGVASTPFTLTPNGPFNGTVTPSDNGAGGSFSPTTLTWAGTYESQTFTYTPSASTVATLSVGNTGGLNNPASLTYTSVPDVGGSGPTRFRTRRVVLA